MKKIFILNFHYDHLFLLQHLFLLLYYLFYYQILILHEITFFPFLTDILSLFQTSQKVFNLIFLLFLEVQLFPFLIVHSLNWYLIKFNILFSFTYASILSLCRSKSSFVDLYYSLISDLISSSISHPVSSLNGLTNDSPFYCP